MKTLIWSMRAQYIIDPMAAPTELRLLPSVDELLKCAPLPDVEAQLGHDLAVRGARLALQSVRERLLTAGDEPQPQMQELARLAAQHAWDIVTPSLRVVINATGVVLHTNLGRAPLSQAAIEAMVAIGRGYSSLEFNLQSGGRGERHSHVQGVLCELLGAEAAIVVNNNAAAVLLTLTALARGKEVILSRGQAVEIGGGFRVPDIMRRSGAKLVEVGTTNRTYVSDYENAITDRTATLLWVHSSNFRLIGFTHMADIKELGELSARRHIPLVDDLGSGCLVNTRQFGLAPEPTVQESLAAGSAVVCFSGDKLLGGPQAGIIVGRKEQIDRIKREPLARAVRVDKSTLAALHATVVEYLKGTALNTIPVWRMIGQPPDIVEKRARGWADKVPGADVVPGQSTIGGGSLPEETLPTWLLRLPRRRSPARLLEALRRHDPPVIGRIQDGAVVLDPRTVQENEEAELLRAVNSALQ